MHQERDTISASCVLPEQPERASRPAHLGAAQAATRWAGLMPGTQPLCGWRASTIVLCARSGDAEA
jgi:hypothetical protein